MKRARKVWIAAVVCGLAVGVLIVALVRRPVGDVVTFRVIDKETGVPISNVVFRVFRPWPKTLQRLPGPLFRGRWRVTDRITSRSGVASVGPINSQTEDQVTVMIDVLTHPNPYDGAVFVHYRGGDYIEYSLLNKVLPVSKPNVVVIEMPRFSYGFSR